MARIRAREPFGQIKILGGTRCRSHQTPVHIRHRFGAAVAASMLLSLNSPCWVNGPGCVRTNAMARTISSAKSICVPRLLFGTPGPGVGAGWGWLMASPNRTVNHWLHQSRCSSPARHRESRAVLLASSTLELHHQKAALCAPPGTPSGRTAISWPRALHPGGFLINYVGPIARASRGFT